MPTTQKQLIVSGVMTGNSLDAVDVATFDVLIHNRAVQSFEQIGFHSTPCSQELQAEVLKLKESLKRSQGILTEEIEPALAQTHKRYHRDVNNALFSARAALLLTPAIDLIGFHGQTLGVNPPSMATAGHKPYTIQMADGAAIADAQRVVTVSDFRSDDLLNGGEGAPFAPGFNALLTPALGVETAVFINAGNTSNIAVIRSKSCEVRGWDCGPCNQFPDQLMREEKGKAIDENGAIALSGRVKNSFIELLWRTAVTRADGTNGLELVPPRSFDPQWYALPEALRDTAVPFQDRIRSVVAFSAYCVAHSLATAIQDGYRPEVILLFGGGWKNPALLKELKDLCSGRATYVLPQHIDLVSLLSLEVPQLEEKIKISDDLGLPSNGMEAGIFAFAAVQRILNQPFTRPSFTNCRSPTQCGAVFIPKTGEVASELAEYSLKDQRTHFKDKRLGRASPVNQ